MDDELGALLAVPAGAAARVWLESARGDRSLTRAELRRLAGRWRRATPRGLRAGLIAPDPVDFAALLVCLVAAGAVVVPLDPAAPAAARAELLHRARADVVLVADGDLEPPPKSSLIGAKSSSSGGVLLLGSGSAEADEAVLLEERQLLDVARAQLTPTGGGNDPLPAFPMNAQIVAVLGSLVSGETLVLGAPRPGDAIAG